MTNQNCYFKKNGIKYVDYKDTELLKKFINPHALFYPKRNLEFLANTKRNFLLL